MKISQIFLGTFCALTIIFSCSLGEVEAARKPIGKIKIIDGKEVSYDDNVVNGSVSEGPLSNGNIIKFNTGAISKEKTLYVPFETQINSYHRGVISATMVVNSLGLGKYSQQNIANLFGTITDESSVGISIQNVLNELVRDSRFQFNWVLHTDENDLDTVKVNVTSAIENGNPVIVNTIESLGDCYLRGHNTGYSLNHFGVVSGYYNYGEKVVYLNPEYGRFNGFVKSQVINVKDLSYAMGRRGYVW